MEISFIQQKIIEQNGDAWLFCDFHNRDSVGMQVLGLDIKKIATRRWYYYVPARGKPIKVVHKIEQDKLAELPGDTLAYVGWKELHEYLGVILKNNPRIFMQYSENNNIPTVSIVDAGTVELVKRLGAIVLSSANLVQLVIGQLDQEEIDLHHEAGVLVHEVKDLAFAYVSEAVKNGFEITEYNVQQLILQEFHKRRLTCDGLLPIVAVNEHAANPHFEVGIGSCSPIRKNDRLLIDLWARREVPKGIYYDITWCAYIGKKPEETYQHLFNVVVEARNKAKEYIITKLKAGEEVHGWQVDDVCRGYIAKRGFADSFIHRTGHSIGREVHGVGVNLDNLETKDDRMIVKGSCFSIEPGIYTHGYGVRSEINIIVDLKGIPKVVGPEQSDLLLL